MHIPRISDSSHLSNEKHDIGTVAAKLLRVLRHGLDLLQMKSPTLNRGAPGLMAAIKFLWYRVMSEGFPSLGVRVFLNRRLRTA